MKTSGINGFFGQFIFLPLCRLESRRVNSGDFFAVGWLNSGSVLTLDYVNFVFVLAAARSTGINRNVEMLMLVWTVDVNVNVSVFRSGKVSIKRSGLLCQPGDRFCARIHPMTKTQLKVHFVLLRNMPERQIFAALTAPWHID